MRLYPRPTQPTLSPEEALQEVLRLSRGAPDMAAACKALEGAGWGCVARWAAMARGETEPYWWKPVEGVFWSSNACRRCGGVGEVGMSRRCGGCRGTGLNEGAVREVFSRWAGEDPPGPPPTKKTPQEILLRVATLHGLAVKKMVGRDASKVPLRARKLAVLLLRVQGLSYPEVGRLLRRDHTTVLSAYRAAGKALLRDDRFGEDYKALLRWWNS